MTENTQELDEILNKAMAVKVENSVPLEPSSVRVVEVRLQYQEAIRRLTLDWHNKQVEAVLDRLDKETERCQDGCWVSIKAERNKLEETTND